MTLEKSELGQTANKAIGRMMLEKSELDRTVNKATWGDDAGKE